MGLTKKTFRDWTEQQLRQAFGLRLDRQHAELNAWIEAGIARSLSEEQEEQLERLRLELQTHVRGWNEEELKLFFIGNLLYLAQISGENYSSFAGRSLQAAVGDYELSGTVDALIASGELEPVAPYFCLQEFKREEGSSSDGAGQVLAAMVTAREINADGEIVYGAYVIGGLWRFLLLDGEGLGYGLSRGFLAESQDIRHIFGILQELKSRVAKRCGE